MTCRPAQTKCLLSLAYLSLAQIQSSAADEVDYLDLVARLDHGLGVAGFGHNLAVNLDRHAALTHPQAFEQGKESKLSVDGVRIAVEHDGWHRGGCDCVGHQKAASGGEAALVRLRTPRLWLPYA